MLSHIVQYSSLILMSSLSVFSYIVQVKVEDIDAYAPKDLLIVTTGSQVSESRWLATLSFIQNNFLWLFFFS